MIEGKMKKINFSLIILSKNEEKIIHDNLIKIFNYINDLKMINSFEILICDSSNDDTPNIVKKISNTHKEIKLIEVRKQGLGAGIKAGLDHASYQVVSITGIDLPTGLSFFGKSIEYIQNNYDLDISVRGSPGHKDNRTFKRKFFSKFYNMLINLFFNLKLADTQSAVTFKREKILNYREQLIDDGPFLQTELLILARKNNLKIFQMNTDYDDKRKDSKIQVLPFSLYMFKKIIKTKMEMR